MNLKRSTSVSVSLKFTVGFRTTRTQIREFKGLISQFLRRRPGDWKGAVDVCVEEVSLAGPMVISVTVSHLKTWQDGSEVSFAKGDLLLACVNVRAW